MAGTSVPAPSAATGASLPSMSVDDIDLDTLDLVEEEDRPQETVPLPSEGDEPPADEAEGDDEPADAEGEDKPEPEGDEKAEPEKPAATIKLSDGSEISLDEAARGYMRQADYSRKTEELAGHKREAQAVLGQQFQEARQALDLAIRVAQRFMPQAPDPALISTDLPGYMLAKEVHERAVAELRSLAGASGQIGQHETGLSKAEVEARAKAELDALARAAPDLATDAGRKTFVERAADVAGKAYGLTPQEIEGIADHRAILILRDAIAYRELQAKKPAAVEKAKTAPPIRSAPRPAPGQRQATRQAQALDRLRREGTIEAAAAALPDDLF